MPKTTNSLPGWKRQRSDVIDSFLLAIDTKLEDLGKWSDSTVHYRYNILEVVTIVVHQIFPQQTASFWNNHFARIGRVAIPSEIETETMIAPPRVKRQTGVRMSYSQATTAM
jgi:hypothetical protein